jgi:hypothetical protein
LLIELTQGTSQRSDEMDELAYTRKKIPGFKTFAEERAASERDAQAIKDAFLPSSAAQPQTSSSTYSVPSAEPVNYFKSEGDKALADALKSIPNFSPTQTKPAPDVPTPKVTNKAPVVPPSKATPAVVPEATPAVAPIASVAPVAPEATVPVAPVAPVAPEATAPVAPDATSVAPDFVPAIPPKSTVSKLSQSEGASAPMSDRKGMDLSGIASFLGDAGGNVMNALTSPEARGALADILGIYGQSRSAAAGQTETNPIFLRKQREFELAKQAKELENQRTLLGTQTETQKALQTQALGLQKYLGDLGFDQSIITKVIEGLNAVNTLQTQQQGEYGTGPNTKLGFLQNFYAPGGVQSQANNLGLGQSNALQVQGIRNLLRFAPQLMSQISGSSGGYQDPLTAAAQGIGQNPGSIWNLNMPNMNSLGQQTFGNNLSLFNTARGMMPSGGGNEPVRQ